MKQRYSPLSFVLARNVHTHTYIFRFVLYIYIIYISCYIYIIYNIYISFC